MLKYCTKLLLPGLIEYFAFVAGLEPSVQEGHSNGVNEVLKAFAAFFGAIQDDYSAFYSCVLCSVLNSP